MATWLRAWAGSAVARAAKTLFRISTHHAINVTTAFVCTLQTGNSELTILLLALQDDQLGWKAKARSRIHGEQARRS